MKRGPTQVASVTLAPSGSSALIVQDFFSGTAPLVQNKALGRMATDSGISPTSNKVKG